MKSLQMLELPHCWTMGIDRKLPDVDWQVSSQMETDLLGEVKTSSKQVIFSQWLLVPWKAHQPSQVDGVQWSRQKKRELTPLHIPKEVQCLQCLELKQAQAGGRKERSVCRAAEWHGACLLRGCCSACSGAKATQGSSEEASPALIQQIQAWLKNRSALVYSSLASQCLSRWGYRPSHNTCKSYVV